MPDFVHLHCHTQYSLLDGAASVKKMIQKAKANEMKAVAITDHGNMFGAFDFYLNAKKNDITPILGCEFYVVKDRFEKKFDKQNKDKRYHQLILAKNAEGYNNLSKLCSLGYIDGFYGKFARIDKELIKKYKEGLIATTCCVAAEVPQTFLHKGEEEAEKVFLEWLGLFGEYYYIELQRHQLKGVDQEGVNQFLLKMSEKHNVPVIATNDSHYVDQQDANAHDILLCVNTGDFKNTPIGDGKGFRFGFENDNFYFKTKEEMAGIFKDVPSAIENTLGIVEKIETPDLKRDILLPHFPLPPEYSSMDEYLKHLAYKGAQKKYGEITSEISDRLDLELKIIKEMGFPGYFLIVQDFINAAKEIGVSVGPGRGSAAGSAVAYCIGITNIDPLKYNLLFERFLNPERVTMPDIDIDFDDDGRQQVIDYVVKKYGENQVAQIITYGTMAAKSAIRDVCRVMQYPLSKSDQLAKMVPDGAGMTLKRAIEENPDLKAIWNNSNNEESQLLRLAENLEGSIRNRGIHAAGVIIAPDDLLNYIPVCTSKDSNLRVTQFDGKLVEDAGMLKMDFLGLKTLTITRDALEMIKDNLGDKINIDEISLQDDKTFQLYQKGETIGTFQFESDGMRGYLKQLKPTSIEDLIAMNALYRPGPMDFIPTYIKRKLGHEKVEYPHPMLEDLLKPTFGIMVYQEQIMQCAQIVAGFSLGKADILRRAMGKKKMEVMQQMKAEFIEGAEKNDIDAEKAGMIFSIMEKFASYGFNRSHSAAYSVLAYQTAYLKANYPAQYMAAVLAHNMNDIKKVIFFIDECSRMGIKVLGPDVNESNYKFNVNGKGEIRFGLGAIKGVGESAVREIVDEREKNGKFTDIFDLAERVNLRAVNKRAFESLAAAGAFDCFPGVYRSQYFHSENGEANAIEIAIKFGQRAKELKQVHQQSLFGDFEDVTVQKPVIPKCEPWAMLDILKKEKELIGFYVSGHPLDKYAYDLKHLCISLDQEVLRTYEGKKVRVGGIITNALEKISKNGNKYGIVTLEDFDHAIEFMIFKEAYLKHKHLFEVGNAIYIEGMVEKKFNKVDEYTIKSKDISIKLLDELREKINSVVLNLDLKEINENVISKLKDIVDSYNGKCRLDVSISDPDFGQKVELHSMNYKIQPTVDFYKEIEGIKEINNLQVLAS